MAEVFNGTTTRPATDYRLTWDMYDRWSRLVGPLSRKVLADGTEISVPAPEYEPPIDKTGKGHQFSSFEGSKKRLRHLTVYDAMRKVQKKREATTLKQPSELLSRALSSKLLLTGDSQLAAFLDELT